VQKAILTIFTASPERQRAASLARALRKGKLRFNIVSFPRGSLARRDAPREPSTFAFGTESLRLRHAFRAGFRPPGHDRDKSAQWACVV